MSWFFRSCSRNPSESILARVKKLGQTFKEHYSLDTEDLPGSHIGTNTKALSPTHNLITAVGPGLVAGPEERRREDRERKGRRRKG